MGSSYSRNLRIFEISQSVCPWQAFPAQSHVRKARGYPSEAPFRISTLGQASGLTYKHQDGLERLARYKHSSLLRKSLNYGCKKIYKIGPWLRLPSSKGSNDLLTVFLQVIHLSAFLNLSIHLKVISLLTLIYKDWKMIKQCI